LKVVIKLTGSIFPSKLNIDRISGYVELFRGLKNEGYKIVVVAGGGEQARKYIDAARMMGASEVSCDLIGINVARLNARLLIAGLREDAYSEPPIDVIELRKAFESGKIVVLGGLQPGQSTNAVGIISAEAIEADLFINTTDVEGVFSEDPKKKQDAKLLRQISADEILRIALSYSVVAGSYKLFDPVAAKMVKRSGIPTRIIDGRTPDNIRRVVHGEELGTLIVS